jgi:hypothetical protein
VPQKRKGLNANTPEPILPTLELHPAIPQGLVHNRVAQLDLPRLEMEGDREVDKTTHAKSMAVVSDSPHQAQ